MTYPSEPWRKDEHGNIVGEDFMVCGKNGNPLPRDEDWERIIACVNACQGIPTERLKTLIDCVKKLHEVELALYRHRIRTPKVQPPKEIAGQENEDPNLGEYD